MSRISLPTACLSSIPLAALPISILVKPWPWHCRDTAKHITSSNADPASPELAQLRYCLAVVARHCATHLADALPQARYSDCNATAAASQKCWSCSCCSACQHVHHDSQHHSTNRPSQAPCAVASSTCFRSTARRDRHPASSVATCAATSALPR